MSGTIPSVEERQIQSPTQAEGLLSLEQLIKNHIQGIEKLKLELKQKREMYVDSFNNNPTYKEHDEKVKEASRAKKSVKAQISKSPDVARLDQQVKDLRFDLKEKKNTLDDLLKDYHEQTGATQLDLFDGSIGEIVLHAKLVVKRGKFK